MKEQLAHDSHIFINFANGSYQWVDIQRFGLTGDLGPSNPALLAAMIAHDVFGNDYATRQLEQEVYEPLRTADAVYRLRDLGPQAFHDWCGMHNEFYEFVLVSDTSELVLVVAADD